MCEMDCIRERHHDACKICGVDADVMYVDQETGLCEPFLYHQCFGCYNNHVKPMAKCNGCTIERQCKAVV